MACGSRLNLDVTQAIAKLHTGSVVATILDPSPRTVLPLDAVIMEAWLKGVSTRLAEGIGSQVGNPRSVGSGACRGSKRRSRPYLERRLDDSIHPAVELDATCLHGRQRRRALGTTGAQAGRRQERAVLGGVLGQLEIARPRQYAAPASPMPGWL